MFAGVIHGCEHRAMFYLAQVHHLMRFQREHQTSYQYPAVKNPKKNSKQQKQVSPKE